MKEPNFPQTLKTKSQQNAKLKRIWKGLTCTEHGKQINNFASKWYTYLNKYINMYIKDSKLFK